MMDYDVSTVDELKNSFIENALKYHGKADRRVLTFIADFILIGKTVKGAIAREDIICNQFRAGYCYYFAHILKTAFNGGEVCWAAPFGHFVWKYGDESYDIEGVYSGEAELLVPESFMGESIKDFKHIRGEVFDATEQDIKRIMDEYRKSLESVNAEKTLNIKKRHNRDNEFYCELTDEINKHFSGEVELDLISAYLQDYGPRKEMDGGQGYVYSIRVPGATRGHIGIDDNDIITEVVFYEEQCYGRIGCFNKSLDTVKDMFIGYKFKPEISKLK